MGDAERFYSARFYSVTRCDSGSYWFERLSAVVVASFAAMLLGGPSADDATDLRSPLLPQASGGVSVDHVGAH